MAGFVHRYGALFVVGEYLVALFKTADNTVYGCVEVRGVYRLFVVTGGLRRFDAQENINELLQQTEVLFQILMMARTNWKISADKALGSDYFAG